MFWAALRLGFWRYCTWQPRRCRSATTVGSAPKSVSGSPRQGNASSSPRLSVVPLPTCHRRGSPTWSSGPTDFPHPGSSLGRSQRRKKGRLKDANGSRGCPWSGALGPYGHAHVVEGALVAIATEHLRKPAMNRPRSRDTTKNDKKHTTPGIPRSSPTLVLIWRFPACLWESGRDPEFSGSYGRMWWFL